MKKLILLPLILILSCLFVGASFTITLNDPDEYATSAVASNNFNYTAINTEWEGWNYSLSPKVSTTTHGSFNNSHNWTNATDDNLTTYAWPAAGNTTQIYYNFSAVPYGTQNSSVVQVKDSGTTINLSIDWNCWDETVRQFRVNQSRVLAKSAYANTTWSAETNFTSTEVNFNVSHNGSSLSDNNFSTYALPNVTGASIRAYYNFTIPTYNATLANSSSDLMVRDSGGYANLSLVTMGCWNNSRLQFRLNASNNAEAGLLNSTITRCLNNSGSWVTLRNNTDGGAIYGTQMQWEYSATAAESTVETQCYNGSIWGRMRETTSGARLYDLRMWWDITNHTEFKCDVLQKNQSTGNWTILSDNIRVENGTDNLTTITLTDNTRYWWKVECEDDFSGVRGNSTTYRLMDVDIDYYILSLGANDVINFSLSSGNIATVGNITANSITANNINITTGNLGIAGNITLGDKIIFRLGEIIDNIVNGVVRVTGILNVSSHIFGGGMVNATEFYQNGDLVLDLTDETNIRNSINDNITFIDEKINRTNATTREYIDTQITDLNNGTIIRDHNTTDWDKNISDDWTWANNGSAKMDNETLIRSHNTTWLNNIYNVVTSFWNKDNWTAMLDKYGNDNFTIDYDAHTDRFKLENITEKNINVSKFEVVGDFRLNQSNGCIGNCFKGEFAWNESNNIICVCTTTDTWKVVNIT